MLVGALDETGSCGKNASWTFDKETGTLTISGTGAIMDYASKKSPFYRQAEITSVVIENGITTLVQAEEEDRKFQESKRQPAKSDIESTIPDLPF